jgi:hypothetical protein
MNNLQSNDLMALSFLIDEEIYVIKEAVIINSASKIDVKVIIETEQVLTEIIAVQIEPIEKQIPPEKIIELIKITDFKYLGENNKYILIVVREPSFDFLKKDDLGFLLKILAAKKLELNDVAIINIEKYASLNFDNLKAFFACSKIITFGINPKILQIEGAVANKKSTFKETSILGTWELTKLQQDEKKKAIFWDELKSF